MGVEPERRAKYEQVANDAARDLEHATAAEILEWALSTFEDKFCVTSSMADAVLIDLASRVQPGVAVVFLDTGYHFEETLRTQRRVQSRYNIELNVVKPKQTVAEQDSFFGPQLHDRDPDACCNLRKVEPLRRTLDAFYAWGSGIRRDETESRRGIGVVEWDPTRGMVKVNPIAKWTQADVDAYVTEHDVVLNPLLAEGYQSIGCAPCTNKVQPGEDPRSGRWSGSGKTECGLHIQTDAPVPTPVIDLGIGKGGETTD